MRSDTNLTFTSDAAHGAHRLDSTQSLPEALVAPSTNSDRSLSFDETKRPNGETELSALPPSQVTLHLGPPDESVTVLHLEPARSWPSMDDDVLRHVFNFLGAADLSSLALVAKRERGLVTQVPGLPALLAGPQHQPDALYRARLGAIRILPTAALTLSSLSLVALLAIAGQPGYDYGLRFTPVGQNGTGVVERYEDMEPGKSYAIDHVPVSNFEDQAWWRPTMATLGVVGGLGCVATCLGVRMRTTANEADADVQRLARDERVDYLRALRRFDLERG